MKRLSTLFAFFFVALGGASAAIAQSMHTTAALETAAQRQFDWAEHRVWYSGIDGNGVQRYASGVVLDPWNVLVSGHQALDNSSGGFTTNMIVGRGSNYMTEPGSIFNVSNVVIHENWNGSIFGQQSDLAILHLATPIPDVSSLTIGSAQLGQQLVGVGYGRPATPSGYLPIDGQARAFNMYVDRFGNTGGTISSDYLLSDFRPLSSRNDILAGGGTPGNSGSGVFNSEGELVGLAVGIAGSAPGYFYGTASLRLDLYEPWIYSNMKVVPTPPTVVPVLAAVAFASNCRRRRVDAIKEPIC